MGRQDGSARRVTEADPGDRSATVLHLDLDAFFASVELLDRPELRDRPVAVGHRAPRSVVSAANYAARAFGVHSAMPMAQALRRCPQLVVLEPHYPRYQELSAQVMRICRSLTPRVEPLSIDEAFLDLAGALELFGSPFEIGSALRRRVLAETGLPCSVGLAATKFVAKLASGLAKPDGLLLVPEAGTAAFLAPLPVRALWGVGAATAGRLERLGLRTIGELAEAPFDTLRRALGPAAAAQLAALALGRDARSISTERRERSIGHEETFAEDVADPAVLDRELLRLSGRVAKRLRARGLTAVTVTLKLRYEDFSTVTRSRTLPAATEVGRELAGVARELLAAEWRERRPVRLIGVAASGLREHGGAAAPLWQEGADWATVERVGDALQQRFGAAAPRPAVLIEPPPRGVAGRPDAAAGPAQNTERGP